MDRRDYYRLPEPMTVCYRLVSEGFMEKSEAAEAFDPAPGFELKRQLFQLELEGAEALRRLGEKDHPLGTFAHNLNRRVMLLGDMVAGETNSDQSEPCRAPTQP